MSAPQIHSIRRQNVIVRASTADAFGLKRRIELLMEELSLHLSALFDELIPQDECLQIETLDIRIDDLSEQDLETELTARILAGISREIEAKRHRVLRDEEGRLLAETVPVHQKTLEAFIYFLRNGILPWWFESLSHVWFEEQILRAIDKFLSAGGHSAEKIRAELTAVLGSPAAQKRLAEQSGNEVFLLTMRLLFPEFADARLFEKVFNSLLVVAGIRDTGEIRNRDRHSADFLSQMKLACIEIISSGKGLTALYTRWISMVSGRGSAEPLRQPGREELLLGKYPADLVPAVRDGELRYNGTGSTDTEDRGVFSVDNQLRMSEVKQVFFSDLREAGGALIANAGLIIVAPFLSDLFTLCGLLKQGVLTDVNRAIAVLHYAAFGNSHYREYDVLLNKVLCGLDGNEPVEIIDQLSDSEKREVDSMLSAAIAYWDVLKSTSADGLREGFLIRRGTLLQKYDDWFLQVEQSAVDALLQHLPWTIGFIRLPWMKTMIRTQWI